MPHLVSHSGPSLRGPLRNLLIQLGLMNVLLILLVYVQEVRRLAPFSLVFSQKLTIFLLFLVLVGQCFQFGSWLLFDCLFIRLE